MSVSCSIDEGRDTKSLPPMSINCNCVSFFREFGRLLRLLKLRFSDVNWYKHSTESGNSVSRFECNLRSLSLVQFPIVSGNDFKPFV